MAGCNCDKGTSANASGSIASRSAASDSKSKSRAKLAKAFSQAWPSGMLYPPLAPWIGAVVSRQAAEALVSRATSSSATHESRSEIPPYAGTSQWDQALCDNPVTMALLAIIVYWASQEYCAENDCEYVGFEIDSDTCTLTHVYCDCPGGGGGDGGDLPRFNPWLEGLIDQFLRDQDDFWSDFEQGGSAQDEE